MGEVAVTSARRVNVPKIIRWIIFTVAVTLTIYVVRFYKPRTVDVTQGKGPVPVDSSKNNKYLDNRPPFGVPDLLSSYDVQPAVSGRPQYASSSRPTSHSAAVNSMNPETSNSNGDRDSYLALRRMLSTPVDSSKYDKYLEIRLPFDTSNTLLSSFSVQPVVNASLLYLSSNASPIRSSVTVSRQITDDEYPDCASPKSDFIDNCPERSVYPSAHISRYVDPLLVEFDIRKGSNDILKNNSPQEHNLKYPEVQLLNELGLDDNIFC